MLHDEFVEQSAAERLVDVAKDDDRLAGVGRCVAGLARQSAGICGVARDGHHWLTA